ncbi:MAG: hypothetical protein M3336_04965 [Chloroflexota bacterium]|nr:hypothetical protein [Chloroflexota bacterium]
MSFDTHCPQCRFVTRQLGQSTPCLLHLALVAASDTDEPDAPPPSGAALPDYDEPYEFGQVHPTVDRPEPFSLREYVRLSLLRCRLREQRGLDVAGGLSARAQERPLASR